MKKEYKYIILLVLITCLSSFGLLRLGLKTIFQKAKVENREDIIENATVATNFEEEKLSPNATFALEKIYDECNHFDYKEAELPKELVNLTEQEIEDYYDDWEVQEFSPNKLILSKEINGYCNEHFVIKLDDEFVNIYRLGAHGELNLYKTTEISKNYLPEEDIKKLTEGITLYGEGKLSSVLEDYE